MEADDYKSTNSVQKASTEKTLSSYQLKTKAIKKLKLHIQ